MLFHGAPLKVADYLHLNYGIKYMKYWNMTVNIRYEIWETMEASLESVDHNYPCLNSYDINDHDDVTPTNVQ